METAYLHVNLFEKYVIILLDVNVILATGVLETAHPVLLAHLLLTGLLMDVYVCLDTRAQADTVHALSLLKYEVNLMFIYFYGMVY
jgi:hypothetical protein